MAPKEQTAMSDREMGQADTGRRGVFLTAMAILLGILALSDATKALQRMQGPVGGLVVLGHKIESVGLNAIAGPLFAIFLGFYVYGIWKMKRWVLPLATLYAFYVPVNLVLFWFLHLSPRPGVSFIVVYLFIALTGSVGTALYLNRHHDRLA
jgi:hypothetical protein